MKEGHPNSPRIAWRRIAALAAVWLALLFWGTFYRMPYDLRLGVTLWSFAVTGGAGLSLGLWKNGRAARRARTGKSRWQHFRAVLGFGLAGASLIGIPASGLLIGCNGAFRTAEPFIVDGSVVAKTTTSGRGTSYLVTIRQAHPSRELRLGVKREAFDQTRLGDRYHEEFQVGLFGWPCRPQ